MLATLLVLGLGLTSQAETPATVSFTSVATPLVRLMPRLAELTHLPLKASEAVEDEVLCIDVHDVDTNELLKRIAQADGCKWVLLDGARVLVPDDAARTVLTHDGFETRVGRVRSAIEEFNPVGKTTLPQNDAPLYPYQSDVSPLFYKLLKGIGAETLAALPPGERIVFSSRPTARQLALPELGPNDIADYAEMVNKARKVSVTHGYFMPQEVSRQIVEQVAKVDFVITRSDHIYSTTELGIGASIVLYDSVGKELDRNPLLVGEKNWWGTWLDQMEHGDTKAPGTPEKPIKLSFEAIRFARAARNWPSKALGTPLEWRRAVAAELLHPELHDPLAYPSEFLSGAADARQLQLVASLPDSFAAWRDLLLTSTTASQVFALLRKDPGEHLDLGEGWVVVSPTDFAEARMDREKLAALSKRFKETPSWSLDDLIDLDRAGISNPARQILLDNWLGNYIGFLTLQIRQDWKFVHFMATLNPSRRAALLNDQSIRISDLGPASREAIEDAVYGYNYEADLFMAPLRVESDLTYDRQPDVALHYDGKDSEDFRAEPTEVAPNGLPADGKIILKFPHQAVLFPAESAGPGWDNSPTAYDPATIDQSALSFVTSEPGVGLNNGSPPREAMHKRAFSKFYIGSDTAMDFRVYVGPESFRPGKIVIRTVSFDDTYTMKTMPADMQSDYKRRVKELEDAYKASRNAGGGQRNAGPP